MRPTHMSVSRGQCSVAVTPLFTAEHPWRHFTVAADGSCRGGSENASNMLKMISKKRKRVVGNITWSRKHLSKNGSVVSQVPQPVLSMCECSILLSSLNRAFPRWVMDDHDGDMGSRDPSWMVFLCKLPIPNTLEYYHDCRRMGDLPGKMGLHWQCHRFTRVMTWTRQVASNRALPLAWPWG